MKKLHILLVLIGVLLGATPAVADDIDDYVRGQMAARKIPGAAVAVIRDGRVVKREAYGLASVEHGVPMRTDTVFTLASMSKAFTAAAIMTLVQEGRLSLDQPLSELLPELPDAWRAVTLRQCLTHTSGLPDLDGDELNVTPPMGDRAVFLKALAPMAVEPPGARVSYNGTGYVLAAMVIERLSGKSYDAFVRDRVLGPSGAKTAQFGDAWDIIPKRAELYTIVEITPEHGKLLARDGRPVIADRVRHYGSKAFPEFMWPTAGLNASLDDLIAFELALRAGRVVSATSLAEMATPGRLTNGRAGFYGVGFIVGQMDGQKTVEYGGGAATWRIARPDADVTVILLTNLQGSLPNQIAPEIVRRVLRPEARR